MHPKTQGDKKIRKDKLHISKFMELGKGKWVTEKDLAGLRNAFLQHMNAYSRILQLRYFASPSDMNAKHLYELVEIPIPLLRESKHGQIEMRNNSRQNPKPGYCTVFDADDTVKFKLYFDGGTERKLQIKGLQKRLCIVHGTWTF